MLAYAATWTEALGSCFAVALENVDVVDQAGCTQSRRCKHDQRVGTIVVIRDVQLHLTSDRNIVDSPTMSREFGARVLLERRIVNVATRPVRREGIRNAAQDGMKAWRFGSFARRQVAVA